MTGEVQAKHVQAALEQLTGSVRDVRNGNAKLGKAEKFRIEDGKLVCDAFIDEPLYRNYGSLAEIMGFPVTFRE